MQSVASERVWEVSVPLATFGLSLGAQACPESSDLAQDQLRRRVGVAAALAREGHIIETLPAEAAHTFILTEI